MIDGTDEKPCHIRAFRSKKSNTESIPRTRSHRLSRAVSWLWSLVPFWYVANILGIEDFPPVFATVSDQECRLMIKHSL